IGGNNDILYVVVFDGYRRCIELGKSHNKKCKENRQN
ncbi:MAG: hypothetical protein H6Q49_690, partial [Deltaproteobacteria bacterium]|nr:hypothetical protein [Deltaproteobacteria bacterium]